MSQTFLSPPNPIPASFDFANNYRSTPFMLYKPNNLAAPQLLAGWKRLISAFTASMNELQDIPGAWADLSIAEYYLTNTMYGSWRWSFTANPQPIFLPVPYAMAGDPVPPPFAANAQPSAAVYIYAITGSTIPGAYMDGSQQGFW